MSIIPNDSGGLWRKKKFVEYQHYAPPADNAIFEYFAKKYNYSFQEVILICWLNANMYHEVSSLFLLKIIPYDENYYNNFQAFLDKNLDRIQIGSAKRYMRCNNALGKVMKWFSEETNGDCVNWIKKISLFSSGETDERKLYYNIQNELLKCNGVARFAVDLFCETFIVFQRMGMTEFKIQDDSTVNWYDGSNLTSGIFNMNYMDEEADKYDRGEMTKEELSKYIELLNNTILELREMIKETFPEQEIENKFFISKICSFRNLFKNNRYGGYHFDRQIGYIEKYKTDFPEYVEFFDEYYEARKEVFRHCMLGELQETPWKDIRKERKKLFTKFGMTGVEEEAKDIWGSILDRKEKLKKSNKSLLGFCEINDR